MRKNPWLLNSIENLVPLSDSDDFKEALKEWSFTGEVIDHGAPTETCELCEHDELRYHYEIENFGNANHLWVGSSCILRFEEIIVYDEQQNELISGEDRKAQLDKALKRKRVNLMLQPLRVLWQKDRANRKYIEWQVQRFKSFGGFEPKDLLCLFKHLKTNGIEYKPSMFPVYLRSDNSKLQMERLCPADQELIWEALSVPQRQRYKFIRAGSSSRDNGSR